MRRQTVDAWPARVARRLQTRVVAPHCRSCARPCCRLETLVLELTWRRLRALWAIETPRSVFDAALERGEGPTEIRAREGLYYAHGSPCPAYRGRVCTVYETPVKPPGCTDFPVYEEDGGLVADLRCEALDPKVVADEIRKEAGQGGRVLRSPHPDFPFLVTFRVRRGRRPDRTRS